MNYFDEHFVIPEDMQPPQTTACKTEQSTIPCSKKWIQLIIKLILHQQNEKQSSSAYPSLRILRMKTWAHIIYLLVINAAIFFLLCVHFSQKINQLMRFYFEYITGGIAQIVYKSLLEEHIQNFRYIRITS